MSHSRITAGSLALLVLAISAGSLPRAHAADKPAFDRTPLEWSVQMARSEMARRGPEAKGTRWEYTSGILALSLVELGKRTGDAATLAYGERIIDRLIGPDGSIAGYSVDEYNIDMVTPGRVVLHLWEKTKDPRYEKAARLLRKQLEGHPRTSEGGFWHKKRYPWQMWLDGLYMGSPFYVRYGRAFKEPAAYDDVAHQILLMDKVSYDPKTGLFFHGWDEKREQFWANKETGCSASFWGRAIGWYGMALVDVLEVMPADQEKLDAIIEVLGKLAAGVARWQDPKSGLWYQVLDQGERKGNYLEATASTMYVYTLAKGVNLGYLPRDKYLPVIRKAWAGLTSELIRKDPDGTLNLLRCCEVAGLGLTSKGTGLPRDGSFDYYVGEPIVENDLKGVGPFIMAGLELDRLLSAPVEGSARKTSVAARGWGDLDAVLARIKAPEFPKRELSIAAFGAKAGGPDNTDAIRKAIKACSAKGGGRVVVPPGEWHTGAIHLESNVDLHVSEGATLVFSADPKKYLPLVFTRWEGVELMNYSPLIYAFEKENVAVTGKGTLDGSATWDTWWAWNDKKTRPTRQKAARDRLIEMAEKGVPVAERVFGEGSFLRPNFIQPYRCKNVLIEGVKIIRSPMWEVHPVLSQNVIVRDLTIETHGPNNDGVDPESCRDVLIERCLIDVGDDCIAIKSGRNADGRRVGVPSENIVVRKCTMKDGHGGVVIGSEISGGTRNVFIDDCDMDSPNLDRALRFKSNAARGGLLESVFMRNVRVGKVAEAVLTIDLLYEEGARGSFPPTVRNVSLENVTSTASPRVLYVRGFPGATIDGLRFSDCRFSGVEEAEVLSGAGSVVFRNVTIEPAKKVRSANSVPPPAVP